jgi:hypothetical protein
VRTELSDVVFGTSPIHQILEPMQDNRIGDSPHGDRNNDHSNIAYSHVFGISWIKWDQINKIVERLVAIV